MNPVKPPYKGEPPSGELSSRFGMTLQAKYLPPDEEELDEALVDVTQRWIDVSHEPQNPRQSASDMQPNRSVGR